MESDKNKKMSPIIKIGLGLSCLMIFFGFGVEFLKSPESFYKSLFFLIIFLLVLFVARQYTKYMSPTSSEQKMILGFIVSFGYSSYIIYSLPESGDLGDAVFLYCVVIPINFLLGGILLNRYLSKKFGDKKLKNYSLIIMGSLLVILSFWALIHNLL